MTPIRLEGDDEDEDEDGDVDDVDEEDEESTPVPRSKRDAVMYVSLKFSAYLSQISRNLPVSALLENLLARNQDSGKEWARDLTIAMAMTVHLNLRIRS